MCNPTEVTLVSLPGLEGPEQSLPGCSVTCASRTGGFLGNRRPPRSSRAQRAAVMETGRRAEPGWLAWISSGASLGGLCGGPAVQPTQPSSAALEPEGKGQVGAIVARKWHLWMQGGEENRAVHACVFAVQACASGISKKKTGRRSLLQEDCSKKLISI